MTSNFTSEKFGLKQKEISLLRDIFKKSLPKNQKYKLWIFGSRARGEHKKYSDIDLILEGTSDTAIKHAILGDLEESNLPYKVDLVLFSDIYPPYLEKIEKEKILLDQSSDFSGH